MTQTGWPACPGELLDLTAQAATADAAARGQVLDGERFALSTMRASGAQPVRASSTLG
ncbi:MULTISPECIES: hypothetical protein [unclassified Streptomyces]|uniref:hypothetical protein n=1 Tax=unclassified Streptomyces TaxID=2593676 RepID=UPI0035E363E2